VSFPSPSSSEAAPFDQDQPHFLAAIGLEHWSEGETTYGSAAIGEALCVPGTRYPRISVLATMVDIVAGSRPTGPINPTVDLRLHLMALAPMSTVKVRCEVLRVGRRLFVAESHLFADDDERPFGRSVVTFINRPIPFTPDAPGLFRRTNPLPSGPIDDLLGVRVVDDTTIEIDPGPRLTNGPGGTLQGGVLALLGELATERALGRRAVAVTDLDIRYLNPVRTGPVQARVELFSATPDEPSATVRIIDVGNAECLVAHVTTTARRL